MARYTITIHDHESEQRQQIEADGMLCAFVKEQGVHGMNLSHSPFDQAKLLVGINEICEETFRRSPEQKQLVRKMLKQIDNKHFFNL